MYINDTKLCYIYLQSAVAFEVIRGLFSGVTTVQLDNLAAETAATMATNHPDYAILAARIDVSNLHKQTKKSFSGTHYCIHFLQKEKMYNILECVIYFLYLNRGDAQFVPR